MQGYRRSYFNTSVFRKVLTQAHANHQVGAVTVSFVTQEHLQQKLESAPPELREQSSRLQCPPHFYAQVAVLLIVTQPRFEGTSGALVLSAQPRRRAPSGLDRRNCVAVHEQGEEKATERVRLTIVARVRGAASA